MKKKKHQTQCLSLVLCPVNLTSSGLLLVLVQTLGNAGRHADCDETRRDRAREREKARGGRLAEIEIEREREREGKGEWEREKQGGKWEKE